MRMVISIDEPMKRTSSFYFDMEGWQKDVEKGQALKGEAGKKGLVRGPFKIFYTVSLIYLSFSLKSALTLDPQLCHSTSNPFSQDSSAFI